MKSSPTSANLERFDEESMVKGARCVRTRGRLQYLAVQIPKPSFQSLHPRLFLGYPSSRLELFLHGPDIFDGLIHSIGPILDIRSIVWRQRQFETAGHPTD